MCLSAGCGGALGAFGGHHGIGAQVGVAVVSGAQQVGYNLAALLGPAVLILNPPPVPKLAAVVQVRADADSRVQVSLGRADNSVEVQVQIANGGH